MFFKKEMNLSRRMKRRKLDKHINKGEREMVVIQRERERMIMNTHFTVGFYFNYM